MAADVRNSSTLTSSLTVQINEAERRLRNRRQLVGIRSATLGQTLRQWITDPTLLFWAGGMGFLMGELTQHQKQKSQDMDHSPDPGHPFFETALNLIKLVHWAQTLFSVLPGARAQPSSPLEASVQATDRSQEKSK